MCLNTSLKKRVMLKNFTTFSHPLIIYSPHLGPYHNTIAMQLCACKTQPKERNPSREKRISTTNFLHTNEGNSMLMNMLHRKETYYKQETFTELFTPTHVFSSLRPHNDTSEKAILYIQTYS